ncbi:MAG TPA: hypothetical protein VMF89_33435, partial [Polyangiales bacterium]|nr:hypothetical protein [Polyangiales bacterium]
MTAAAAGQLEACICRVHAPAAVVLLVASGGARALTSARHVAGLLNEASFSTVVCDLGEASGDSDSDTTHVLARRVLTLIAWIEQQSAFRGMALTCYCTPLATAATLQADAARPGVIRAIVSTAGEQDLAGPGLASIRAPSL